jgi:hypothetical protein
VQLFESGGGVPFTYALKNLKRAVIVGETTGGGAHPTRAFKVTEHFVVSVPFARSISPITHTDWEGTGVSPNIAVPERQALTTAYRSALREIANGTTMQFMKRLRAGIRRGEITCTVRIWASPHVKVGGRYKLDEGEIEVDAMHRIDVEDITPELARQSGFASVDDLLKIAKHGKGSEVYLIKFHYIAPARAVKRRKSGRDGAA